MAYPRVACETYIIINEDSKPRTCLIEAPLSAYNKTFFFHSSPKFFFNINL